MFVGLVDVNTPGHIQQLLQPGLVVLLDGAEDGGQHEVVVLGNITAISPLTIMHCIIAFVRFVYFSLRGEFMRRIRISIFSINYYSVILWRLDREQTGEREHRYSHSWVTCRGYVEIVKYI